MSNYAEAKISDEDKIKFQNDICQYYSVIVKDLLNINGKAFKVRKSTKSLKQQPMLQHELIKELLKHETNIYACIQRMVEGSISVPRIDDEGEKDEEEDEEIINTLNDFD